MTGHRVVRPVGRVAATVEVPGSKSIANRALVCAALAEGTSTLTNLPDGDDTTSMLTALERLGVGVGVAQTDGSATEATIAGGDTGWPPTTLHAGLAGTTSRFLTALIAVGQVSVTVDGDPPLRRRPFAPLHDALGELGVRVSPGERDGHLPVTITGPPTGTTATIRGDISSQFISALMMIGPRLPNGLRLELTSPLVSLPYVELTAAVMASFGATDVHLGPDTIVVGPGRYEATELAIEPDASSASYPLALAAVCGGRVTVPGLGLGARQGDVRFVDLLGSMGCGITQTRDRLSVESGGTLRGVDVDMADISDLVPTLAVVAACADSTTRIRGVGFIRDKESDRLGDLATELRVLGVDVDEVDDGLDVRPSLDRLRGGRVDTHHDHRLAMAFGVLGSRVAGVEVADPDVVTKSWPGFWSMLATIGRDVGA